MDAPEPHVWRYLDPIRTTCWYHIIIIIMTVLLTLLPTWPPLTSCKWTSQPVASCTQCARQLLVLQIKWEVLHLVHSVSGGRVGHNHEEWRGRRMHPVSLRLRWRGRGPVQGRPFSCNGVTKRQEPMTPLAPSYTARTDTTCWREHHEKIESTHFQAWKGGKWKHDEVGSLKL